MRSSWLALFHLSSVYLIAVLLIERTVVSTLQSRHVPAAVGDDVLALTQDDPKIGESSGSLGPLPTELRNRSLVVIIASDCGSCMQERLQRLQVAKPAIPLLVLVKMHSPLAAKDLPKGTYVLPMPKDLEKRWNACFLPRAYAIDRTGLFRYIQSPQLALEEGVNRAYAAL